MSHELHSSEKKLSSSKTITLAMLPLRDIVIFPYTVVPLFVGRDKSIQALDYAVGGNNEILLVAQKEAKTNDPSQDDIFKFGTVAHILQLLRLPDGTVKVLVEGKKRAKILNFLQEENFFCIEAAIYEEEISFDVENEALIRSIKVAFDHYVRLNKRIPPEVLLSISQIDCQCKLADALVAHITNLKLEDKQKLLQEMNPKKRLEDLYGFIQAEIEIMRVEKKIHARVKKQMEKTQKEYYLNEQISAIQKELGDKDDARAEIRAMEKLAKKKKLSIEAKDRVDQEIKKLKNMSSMSAEANVVRNYIETVLSLPWNNKSQEIKDISFASKILNRDHFGLEKIKERLLEYLAVHNLVDKLKGPILCLVGPPGVGKTSLAYSIAESLGRKFVRISLGGVRDQAEIRGHRKTYIGSMPGKFIMALKKAGTSNPVVLLDEIDKMSSDFRGDPASALLEVLDPEQNNAFNDHYLDLDYDLSGCLFLATANTVEGIPYPLVDRMEITRIAGYTEDEKVEICQQFLVPKQIKENGLSNHKVSFKEEAIRELIRYYTREAGVRNLSREVSTVLRKLIKSHVTKNPLFPKESTKSRSAKSKINTNKTKKMSMKKTKKFILKEQMTPQIIADYLGPRRYRIGLRNKADEVGICSGLAWTAVGGEILMTEVAVLPGKGQLLITGKLGEVMQESAKAALSYVRSRAEFLELDEDFYRKVDIHIHFPEGAIPKDGPSAGLCMATALTSALTGRPVNRNIAMTGEITLRGRALPIGGLKEKSLAAQRAGIKKIIIPKENEKDLQDIPEVTKKDIKFVKVEHMDEVLIHALVWNDKKTNQKKDKLYTKLSKRRKEL